MTDSPPAINCKPWVVIFLINLIACCPAFSHARAEGVENKIVFIAASGEAEEDVRYFDLAEAYFRLDPMYQSELLIKSEDTLVGILHYLQRHPPPGNAAWDTIHLIAHNSRLGLSIPVRPGAKPYSDLHQLKELASASGAIPGITPDTKIIVWACGLGKNKTYINQLQKVFGGMAGITSPDLNTYFYWPDDRRSPDMYLAQEYFVMLNSVSETAVIDAFHAKYPDVKIDWSRAYHKRSQFDLVEPFSEIRTHTMEFSLPSSVASRFATFDDLVKRSRQIRSQLKDGGWDLTARDWNLSAFADGNQTTLKVTASKVSILQIDQAGLQEFQREHVLPIAPYDPGN